VIDVRPGGGARGRARLLASLQAELSSGAVEPMVAYRGGQRWIQGFEHLNLRSGLAEPRLREQGVYWITGGMGGIGLRLAEYLSQKMKARIVLTGRSWFPEREEWGRWRQEHGEDDEISVKISQLEKIEQQGGEVLVCPGDVADEGQMRAVLAAIQLRFGALHGVIHAAGIGGAGLVQRKSPADVEAVFRPKIQGTLVLHKLLQHQRADWLVLCSSIASVVGGVGQSDYCAANSFLDAFSRSVRGEESMPITIALNWDGWQQVGMRTRFKTPAFLRRFRKPAAAASIKEHSLVGKTITSQESSSIFCAQLSPETDWVIGEHRIGGTPLLPGAAFLELAWAAAESAGVLEMQQGVELRNLLILNPLTIADGENRTIYTVLERHGNDWDLRVISKNPSGSWQEHAAGKIGLPRRDPVPGDLSAIRARCTLQTVQISAVPVAESASHISLGKRWNCVQEIHLGKNEALAKIELHPQFADDLHEYKLHPALLDVATSFATNYLGGGLYLPFCYGHAVLKDRLPGTFYSHLKLLSQAKDSLVYSVTLFEPEGAEILWLDEFILRRPAPSNRADPIPAVELSRDVPAREHAPYIKVLEEQLRAFSQASTHDVSSESPEENDAQIDFNLTPDEGAEVFHGVLNRARVSQVLISTVDLKARIRHVNELTMARIAEGRFPGKNAATRHARPDMETPFVPPKDGVESQLASIWKQVLGIQEIGANDNFFELGGDSLLGIQVVARAKEMGIGLRPADVFERQTISALAQSVDATQPGKSDQAWLIAAGGEVPMTPIQRWILESDDSGRRCSGIVVEVSGVLELQRFTRALLEVLGEHDIFRLQYERKPNGAWRQNYGEIPSSADDLIVDITSAVIQNGDGESEAAAARALSQNLNLTQAPLFRFGLLPSPLKTKAIFVAHESIMDPPSWRLFLKQLAASYQLPRSEAANEKPVSGSRSSFGEWAACCSSLVLQEKTRDEVAYWRNACAVPVKALPVDRGDDGREDAGSVATELDEERSFQLWNNVSAAYQTEVSELLLTALAGTLGEWSKTGTVRIEIISYERGVKDLDAVPDVAQSLGMFAHRYPAVLEVRSGDPGDQIKSIKEQLRGVPRQGWGYGILTHLSGAVQDQLPDHTAQISFAYFGLGDELQEETGPFCMLHDLHAAVGHRPLRHLLEVRAQRAGKKLQIIWNYRQNRHDSETIELLSGEFIKRLNALIDHCVSPGAGGFTVSDFPEADLNQGDLEKLLSQLQTMEQTKK
jgi:non-ribosomal peptide synthase protein (TIGR01720 family)